MDVSEDDKDVSKDVSKDVTDVSKDDWEAPELDLDLSPWLQQALSVVRLTGCGTFWTIPVFIWGGETLFLFFGEGRGEDNVLDLRRAIAT